MSSYSFNRAIHRQFLSVLLLAVSVYSIPGLAQDVNTYAGGGRAVFGEPAVTQLIETPAGIAYDGTGGFYISAVNFSLDIHSIYHVNAGGTLRLVAGSGGGGFSGDGGPAIAAQLFYPSGLAVDSAGNLFVADSSNNRIRKIAPDGIITTVAGDGGSGPLGDGGPAVQASLSHPNHIGLDGQGNLFVADNTRNRIRKISPDGVISTVAGSGVLGFSGDGGPAIAARITPVSSMVVAANGVVFFSDSARIRRVTAAGIISTYAGIGVTGFSGDGGPATSAQISVESLAIDNFGNLLIGGLSRIRRVTANGIITTIAGSGLSGSSGDGGPATFAQFGYLAALAADSLGNILMADRSNFRIRQIAANGVIQTVAGNGTPYFSGDGGPATSARLNSPSGVTFDASGNLLFGDSWNGRVRKVTPSGIISTFAGGGSTAGSGDGGLATAARLSTPSGIAIDSTGNTYILDCIGTIRKVDRDGIITTIYGSANSHALCTFSLDYYGFQTAPSGIAVDAEGSVFVAETNNNRVQKITPAGVVTTVAGVGTSGFGGDGGRATEARLSSPGGLAIDKAGNLFISDLGNARIRKVDTDGIISTVAGNGGYGYTGDGGSATSAQLGLATGIAVDSAGSLYAAIYLYVFDVEIGSRIRKISSTGTITTIAGSGISGSGGDGGPALSAQFGFITGLAVGIAGNLFVADSTNGRIRIIGPVSPPTLSGVSPNLAGQSATANITLTGTSFFGPLTINAGADIAVSNVKVISGTLATATLTTTSNTVAGLRSLTVSTSIGTTNEIPFTVVPPFPDLSITSSHSANPAVGYDVTYTVGITNQGGSATSGPITVTDTLPSGMTFSSATGSGWSCSSSNSAAICESPGPLAPGMSTTLTFVVNVGSNPPVQLLHGPKVEVDGDLDSLNNTASDTTAIAHPVVTLVTALDLVPGQQQSLDLRLPAAFPYDISGTLKVAFAQNAVNPADDPAIQFETGGREVQFTIPANTVQAVFGNNPSSRPLLFQAGTVAGTLTFSGTLQTGSLQTPFSITREIARQAPIVQRIETDTRNGFAASITVISTLREITDVYLSFETTPPVQLTCGNTFGCVLFSGSLLRLITKTLFDPWFVRDSTFGGLSTVRIPLSIRGSVEGVVRVTLYNRMGASNTMSFQLP